MPDNYLQLPGITGNCLETADEAALQLATDIDLRVRVSLDNYTGGMLLTKQDTSSAWDFEWVFLLRLMAS